MDALGRGLLKEFPNPNRVGCPGAEILKKIASHKMRLSEVENWLDHLGSCSPCYGDFSRFRQAYQRGQKRILLGIAAGILLVATVGMWGWLHYRSDSLLAQTATLDLRDRSLARGAESNPNDQPLEVDRAAKALNIYLPRESSEGAYDVRIVTLAGDPVVAGSGTAESKDQVTLVHVTVNLTSARPGPYILQIRKSGLGWSSYALVVR